MSKSDHNKLFVLTLFEELLKGVETKVTGFVILTVDSELRIIDLCESLILFTTHKVLLK
jgi:hypothetical protein